MEKQDNTKESTPKVVKAVKKTIKPIKKTVDYEAKYKKALKENKALRKEMLLIKEDIKKSASLADKNFRFAEVTGQKNTELIEAVQYTQLKEQKVVGVMSKLLDSVEDIITLGRGAINQELSKKLPKIGKE